MNNKGLKKPLYRRCAERVLAAYFRVRFQLARWGMALRVRAPLWRSRLAHPCRPRLAQSVFIAWSSNPRVGLFAYVSWFLMSAMHTEKTGDIPVVDMQNPPNTYLAPEKRGRENSWEYFFEQPGGLTLAQAYTARRVTFCKLRPQIDPAPYDPTRLDWIDDAALRQRFKAQYRRYIRYTPEVAAHVEAAAAREFGGRQNVVGVLCRGTDYTAAPAQHHRQPTAAQAMALADAMIEKHGCQAVYLATEDIDILSAFKARYGEKLIYNTDSIRLSAGGDSLQTQLAKKAIDRRQAGLNYITDLDLLARCDCLVTGIVSPTPLLFLMKRGEYRDYTVFDKGRFE